MERGRRKQYRVYWWPIITKRRINRTKTVFPPFLFACLILREWSRFAQTQTSGNASSNAVLFGLVCYAQKAIKRPWKPNNSALIGLYLLSSKTQPYAGCIRIVVLFAVQPFFKCRQGMKSAYLFAFIYCALNRCNAALFAICGFNRRLFAIRKAGRRSLTRRTDENNVIRIQTPQKPETAQSWAYGRTWSELPWRRYATAGGATMPQSIRYSLQLVQSSSATACAATIGAFRLFAVSAVFILFKQLLLVWGVVRNSRLKPF